MGVIRSWSTNAGVCNKPGALGYGFARGETTNCLFSFEVAHLSFEQSERGFSWQAQKRPRALNHSGGLVVRRRPPVSPAAAAARPQTCLMSQVNAAAPPATPPPPRHPAYSQTPFPSLPSHAGTRAAFPSLMENGCLASFWSFFFFFKSVASRALSGDI